MRHWGAGPHTATATVGDDIFDVTAPARHCRERPVASQQPRRMVTIPERSTANASGSKLRVRGQISRWFDVVAPPAQICVEWG
jgi:hypothetical protein